MTQPQRDAFHAPRLAIVGPGRCGKDTAGEWLRDNTILRFEGGCSWAARHYMADRLNTDTLRSRKQPVDWSKEVCREWHMYTPESAYDRRHEDRMKWYTYLNEFRKDDPAKLVRLVLQTSDFVCGIRDVAELKAAKDEGLIDLIVWVDRLVEVDPTLTFQIEDADIVILNDGTLEEYLAKWKRLAAALGILKG